MENNLKVQRKMFPIRKWNLMMMDDNRIKIALLYETPEGVAITHLVNPQNVTFIESGEEVFLMKPYFPQHEFQKEYVEAILLRK